MVILSKVRVKGGGERGVANVLKPSASLCPSIRPSVSAGRACLAGQHQGRRVRGAGGRCGAVLGHGPATVGGRRGEGALGGLEERQASQSDAPHQCGGRGGHG